MGEGGGTIRIGAIFYKSLFATRVSSLLTPEVMGSTVPTGGTETPAPAAARLPVLSPLALFSRSACISH